MEWAELFSEGRTAAFILLFVRFSSLFMAVPIFSHANIPMSLKAAMAFFFTVIFYDSLPTLQIPTDTMTMTVAILGEMLFGLTVGIILQLAYHVITFAGGQISFMMGFSLASAIDPQSGVSMPIINQFLSLVALMILLALDLHHWIILLASASIATVPLGGFMVTPELFRYIMHGMLNMFVVGFMIAFPITALSMLADVIFGMLMKTMPQFNLLVIGMPIKIGVAFLVLMATLSAMMMIVGSQMQSAYNFLEKLL
ncbi:MAG TPA: flagellar biosynthetic protein FliR [Sulfuricurvum sp.]|nr:MAG: flagellar biosynthetic protein FliR [Campylobacterales bacterium 16-40-21]OZA03416.1 MAG: flagellar biosynthetic protein FliR [Sulfuricurvum sp. 17-40-25]HQS66604.1 flagellar biosynthetic protein FliR [Sulfuricurvum sp.]HQT35447.1 flagellar biosynthetic protein FliR [Sulfuricurvum sp.]